MNQVFTHPGQPEMQAEVLLASQGPDQRSLYTVRGRMPRCIWPEVLTHRRKGRNGRSSRAVPMTRMIEEVRTRPFVPWHWLKNQKGMQGGDEHHERVIIDDETDSQNPWTMDNADAWFAAAEDTAEWAARFARAGYHKQITNRLLEPFMWIDGILTADEWQNFLWLRDDDDAEPHLRDWARLVAQAIDSAEIERLEPGDWHQPYITEADIDWAISNHDSVGEESVRMLLNKVSAARCARISYTPFDGNASYEAELRRYNLLANSRKVHASPLEHQATPDRVRSYYECPVADDGTVDHGAAEYREAWASPDLHGNLNGYIQHRKLVPGESVQ